MTAYWSSKQKDTWWEDLARMVLKTPTTPPMTTEEESVFSAGNVRINDWRSCLQHAITEQFEYYMSWEREGQIVEVYNEVYNML